MPMSSMIRRPPTPSTSFSRLSVWGGRAMTSTFTPRRAAPLDGFFPLERVGGRSHDVHFHPASRRPDQALDDHHVLEALVLDEQPVPRLVDEAADPIPPGARAPDDMTLVARREGLTVPVGLEALDDLGHVVAVR